MISVIKRDGMARIATLNLAKYLSKKTDHHPKKAEFTTPFMINFLEKENYELVDKMDFGLAPSPLKIIDKERYEVLKSKDDNFTVATGLNKLLPKKKVDLILECRFESWLPFYTPCLATPQNLPLLIYLGVDIVDNILPIVDACLGKYMLGEGTMDFETIREFPCSCPICSKYYPEEVKSMDFENKAELIGMHNTYVLENQITLVKEQIRTENLRNLVESRAKTHPELFAILRFADANQNFRAKIPIFKRSKALFTSLEVNRPDVVKFFENSINAYEPAGKTLVLLPCSATKPYSFSKTHRTLKKLVDFRGVNEIIISSPLVSPREFELCYPVMNYDTTVTGEWTGDEIDFVADRLSRFIMKGNFNKIIAHVDGSYVRIVQKAVKTAGLDSNNEVDVVFTGEGDILSKKAIDALNREMNNGKRVKFNIYSEIFAHMTRYQFGINFKTLFNSNSSEVMDKIKISGRYPNIGLYKEIESKDGRRRERIMRIDMRYGMLDVDLPFAEYIIKNKTAENIKRGRIFLVKIDEFVPKGTVFAPGVLEADIRIKPNDIVIFHNKKVFGVGLAKMYGGEMLESETGHAFEVRKVKIK